MGKPAQPNGSQGQNRLGPNDTRIATTQEATRWHVGGQYNRLAAGFEAGSHTLYLSLTIIYRCSCERRRLGRWGTSVFDLQELHKLTNETNLVLHTQWFYFRTKIKIIRPS